jgi:hypothetical protein
MTTCLTTVDAVLIGAFALVGAGYSVALSGWADHKQSSVDFGSYFGNNEGAPVEGARAAEAGAERIVRRRE